MAAVWAFEAALAGRIVRDSKPNRISGAILDDRVVGQVDGQDYVYDMRTGQFTPSDAFTVIQGVTGDEERWQTLHDVMSSSRVLGEVVSINLKIWSPPSNQRFQVKTKRSDRAFFCRLNCRGRHLTLVLIGHRGCPLVKVMLFHGHRVSSVMTRIVQY